MEWLIGIVTAGAALVTIAWFVRDIRKENSKILKMQTEILARMEEGQREGFERLAEISERVGENTTKGIERLAEINERSAETATKGLERLAEIATKGFETLAQILAKTGR